MGPLATQMLCDLGADVIKIEPPGGDGLRTAGDAAEPDMGPLFWHLNRGKTSVVADLRTDDGRAAVVELCRTADVFATNVRPGGLTRAGLDPGSLLDLNPRLIYASMVGFGQDGPYAPLAAYDDLMQAYCGLVHTLGYTSKGDPHFVPYNLCDRSVGLYAFGCISAALFERERSGRGQHIEIPMFETMAALIMSEHLNGQSFTPPTGPSGYQRVTDPSRRPYRTSDGFVCALVYNPGQWQRFLAVVGVEERPDKPDEQTFLHGQFASRSTAEWLQILRGADVPVAPLNTLDDVLIDPHLTAVQLFEEVDGVRTPRVPSRWSATPPGKLRAAPRLSR